MDKNKLKIIRKKLDKLDYKILLLIKKRTILVNQVIHLKKLKKEIVDKSRIKDVLKKVRNHSIRKNIDTQITKKIWMSMIHSYIDYEKRNFKKK